MSTSWEIKHRLGDAINAHDLRRIRECYSPDAVLVTPLGVSEGHDQIEWCFERFFKGFPDLRYTPWLEVDCDDPAVTEWTITGTHTGPFLLHDGTEMEGTGRPIRLRASCEAHVENDKIVTHQHYWDQLELYSQLGFGLVRLPSPAG
ncbi:hypothetical protein Psi02_38310 [Planotetraspora silvatica]|uniref:SnoaL-like polyketide cyclase n=1 Tax=Planotetraspora silvatica TaxID=234614 RepID=A0A8J3XMG8_9ACTN|nr:ester cyclase [Planotetraspora silvatica]GII47407.1 hypothetical protein Psi02_38310 [Planotetraspora silvatica]